MNREGRVRRKVLFFAEAVTLAHVARPYVLAGSLDAAEYETVLAVHPRYGHLFQENGVRQIPLDSVTPAEFLDALKKGRPLYSFATLSSYVETDLEIIDRERPDLIIGDFRLSLSISARLRKIPYAAISNAYWSPFAIQPFPIPEHPLVGLLGVGPAQFLFDLVRPGVFARHAIPLGRVRRRYGLKGIDLDLRRVYTDSDALLYADVPGLVEMRPLPSSHRFIGPVLWSPAGPRPDWWELLDDSKPIIYLTLGSSGRSDLLQMVAEAVAGLPVAVMVATAGQSKLQVAAENLYLADYLPGEAAAARASVVISNGGSLTSYQALKYGVPVLGIAGNLDQHLNMSALERQGAGIRLRTDLLRPTEVRRSLARLLEEPGFPEAAAQLGARLSNGSIWHCFQRILREL